MSSPETPAAASSVSQQGDTPTGQAPGFTSPVLTLERRDHVAVLWLDRPDARNALGPELWRDLPNAMAEIGEDRDVRAVVLAARGRDFSVGLDLKAMFGNRLGPDAEGGHGEGKSRSMAVRATTARHGIRRLQASVTSVAECPKPVIAAVHGYCIGGGVDLIAACDIRLASASAVFSVREAKMAIVADLGSLQRLPGIIGRGHVAELAYTGKDIDAERARQIGLVNDVLADRETAVEAAVTLAGEIAANSPLAVQGTKAVLRAGEPQTVAQGLEYVAAWNAGALQSDDLMEALAAFMERRAPKFTGS